MIENVTLTVIRDDIRRIRMRSPPRIHSVASDVKLNQTEKFRQASRGLFLDALPINSNWIC